MTSSASPDAEVAKAVRARRLTVIALIVVVAVLLVVAAHAFAGRDPFASLPGDSSVTVGHAGSFPSQDEGPLDEPFGIAIQGRRVYVAESGTGSVRIFSLYGKSRGRIVLPASDERCAVPTAIALTDDGRIAVVDAAVRTVGVYEAEDDESADVLFILGGDDPVTAPVRPVGVAFADGEFFVVDADERLVKVFDEEGRFVRALGEHIAHPIENPGGIAVVDGEVLITDTRSGRVAVLDASEGEEVQEFPDMYAVPRAITPAGDLFVLTDVLGGAVYLTDVQGVRTHVIDRKTVPGEAPWLPEGAAWAPVKNRVYVTDNLSGYVQVFNVRI